MESRTARGSACHICHRSKLRCSYTFPCDRCFRLGLRCIPQSHGERGGGSNTYGSGGGGSNTYGSGGGGSNTYGSGGGGSIVVSPQRRPRSGAADADGSSAEESDEMGEGNGDGEEGGDDGDQQQQQERPLTPLLDVVFQRVNPRPVAELMAAGIISRHRAGTLLQRNLLRFLRYWQFKSLLCGADASWGMVPDVMRELKLSAVDIEPPRAQDGVAPTKRRDRAQDYLQAMLAKVPGVRQSHAFKIANYGQAAVLMMLPSEEDGLIAEATNERFADWFRGIEQVFGDMVTHRTLSGMLLFSLLAPGDRELFCDQFLDAAMTQTAPRSVQFLKTYTRTGDIEVYLFELRAAWRDGDGLPAGVVCRIERCPPSKYVSTQPRVASVVKTFRQMSQASGASSSSSSSAPAPAPAAAAPAASAPAEASGEGNGVDNGDHDGGSGSGSTEHRGVPTVPCTAPGDGGFTAASSPAPAADHCPPTIPGFAALPVPSLDASQVGMFQSMQHSFSSGAAERILSPDRGRENRAIARTENGDLVVLPPPSLSPTNPSQTSAGAVGAAATAAAPGAGALDDGAAAPMGLGGERWQPLSVEQLGAKQTTSPLSEQQQPQQRLSPAADSQGQGPPLGSADDSAMMWSSWPSKPQPAAPLPPLLDSEILDNMFSDDDGDDDGYYGYGHDDGEEQD